MRLPIVQHRSWYYAVSGLFIAVSIVALGVWGLRLGIDFTGGSLLEVSFEEAQRPAASDVRDLIAAQLPELGDVTVQPVDERGMILRLRDLNEEEHQQLLAVIQGTVTVEGEATTDEGQLQFNPDGTASVVLNGTSGVVEQRFDSIGPTIGQELRTKSFTATLVVVIGIILYIAWCFRKVGRPVASWKYGVIAVVTLLHDVIITLGVFAALGYFLGVEINTAFVAAVLTILGYSVNDTIVVFDRVRENIHRYQGAFEDTVNRSLNETFVRSINTSLTVLLTLTAIFFFGGESIKYFALALIVGIFFGTYSSIFIASSLLVTWQKWADRRR